MAHPPRMKVLVPAERVDEVVPYVPTRCAKCDEPLPAKAGPQDPEPMRHQVAELPPMAAKITELAARKANAESLTETADEKRSRDAKKATC